MTAGDHQPPVLAVVFTGSSFHPQHDNEDPKPTEPQSPKQPPPHSETLGSSLNIPQSHLNDHGLQISQQSQQKQDQQTGITRSTIPEPIATSPPPSLTNSRNKRKKGGNRSIFKIQWLNKIRNLTDVFNPIPFVPKLLDLRKHEDVLKRLGLYKFSKMELDRSIRTDLLVQLIGSYDSKKRCSYVNEKRIRVNRADLASALELPVVKQDKGGSKVDLDAEVFSGDVIGFIEDFVFNWMLLHDESWVMPVELVNLTRCIRDGHLEKLDSASLVWYKVKKELAQGDKLVDCYYASHLQQLIRSQHGELLMLDGGGDEGEKKVKADEEHEEKEQEEKVSIVQDNDVKLTLGPYVEKEEQENVKADEEREEDVSIVQDNDVELPLGPYVEKEEQEDNVKADEGQEEKLFIVQDHDVELTLGLDVEKEEQEENVKADEEQEEKLSIVQDNDVELTLGLDVEKVVHQDVKEDDETMVDAKECNMEVMEEQVKWKNDLSEHILQRCQGNDLNNYEETKLEVVDEPIEQVEDEGGADSGERFIEGFSMEANDDLMDRDRLTDHIPYSSHKVSAIDPFMSHSGPSCFNNGGKRVMEPEEDMHHLDENSKRLKTDEMWDQKQNDFGFCMVQLQQWMEKAKMIHGSNEEVYVNSRYHQDSGMNELRDRHQLMELMIKSKDEELVQKNAEVFRLERELYLMRDLVEWYKKAVNDTRFKFSEYRKRFPLQEEPLYKDAGPGGLVLSTRELEKRRLKQEEDKMKFQTFSKGFEEERVYHMKLLGERVLKMAEKLVFVGNEVKRLKEIATRRKEEKGDGKDH